LLPFLLEDPDPSVVSSAAMEMALLRPLERGEPLTGPRYVSGLVDQVNGDDARAGVVAALLQLGDERLEPLVAGGWKSLGDDGRQTLALLVQGFHGLNGPTVRFLAGWLEDEVRSPQSAAFGMVAATFARAGRHASAHGIVEFERVFPLTAAPEGDGPGPARRMTIDEFRPSIEERLLRTAGCEAPPRLMPHVLSYWGLGEEAYRLAAAAGVVASGAAAASGPVRLDLVPEWPEDPERETLLEWGIFNPIGPTINTLRLTRAAGAAALVYTQYHPTGSISRIMSVLPETCGDDAVKAAVSAVMAGNGRHGVWMVRSLPDYVYLPAASPVGALGAAASLAAAREAAVGAGEEAVDLQWHSRRLEALAADPWGTTSREIEQARAGAVDGFQCGARPAARPLVEDYLRWLEVAAASAHASALRSEIPVAWHRASGPEDEGEDGDG
jgi:hypothetical protein